MKGFGTDSDIFRINYGPCDPCNFAVPSHFLNKTIYKNCAKKHNLLEQNFFLYLICHSSVSESDSHLQQKISLLFLKLVVLKRILIHRKV
jgi:hypothetical protein